MNPYHKSEQAVFRLRRNIFNYPDDTPKGEQAGRVLRYLIRRKVRGYAYTPAPTGPYSGLTRAELSASRTCETDWF